MCIFCIFLAATLQQNCLGSGCHPTLTAFPRMNFLMVDKRPVSFFCILPRPLAGDGLTSQRFLLPWAGWPRRPGLGCWGALRTLSLIMLRRHIEKSDRTERGNKSLIFKIQYVALARRTSCVKKPRCTSHQNNMNFVSRKKQCESDDNKHKQLCFKADSLLYHWKQKNKTDIPTIFVSKDRTLLGLVLTELNCNQF